MARTTVRPGIAIWMRTLRAPSRALLMASEKVWGRLVRVRREPHRRLWRVRRRSWGCRFLGAG
jgi:hypothetical protein